MPSRTLLRVNLTNEFEFPSDGPVCPFDTVDFDERNEWHGTPDFSFIPLDSGKYRITGKINTSMDDPAVEQDLEIRVNGASVSFTRSITSENFFVSLQIDDILTLTAGQAVSLGVYISGSTGYKFEGGGNCYLIIERV